jgi:hypothetical protein
MTPLSCPEFATQSWIQFPATQILDQVHLSKQLRFPQHVYDVVRWVNSGNDRHRPNENHCPVSAHVMIGVTDQLNARLGCDQFPEMEAGVVFEYNIAAQKTFGTRALFGVNIL